MNDLGMPPTGLRGKAALVTGVSRRSGIGAAVCRMFAGSGVDIAFTHWTPYDRRLGYVDDDHDPARIERELRDLGARVVAIPADFSVPDAPARVIEATVAALGAPHILINNAAHWSPGGIESITAETMDTHLAVNVRSMALLCREFVERFPGGPGGRIVNLTSGQSVAPMPDTLAYATSKGAIEAFTQSLAPQVAAAGITVNAVDPGATDTGWINDALRAQIVSTMQMGRVGRPEDAARLIAFLCSDAGEWITGQVLHSRGA